MMNLNKNILLKAASFGLVAAGISMLSSCTVKEDRVPCPCYLNVSFADREEIPEGAEVGILGWDTAEMFRVGIDVADYDPYWVRGVHKGYFNLASYRGVDAAATASSQQITIRPGHQADSLYAYFTEVDATGDMAYAEVNFHKQFCTVHLDIQRSAAEMQKFRFLVEGNTCGFDLFSFNPIAGDFYYEPKPEAGKRVVDFRIPRQADNSMTVTLWMQNESGMYELLGVYPLGEYIARTGYNWNAEDLQDVYIVIDLVLGQITISVDGWEHGQTFMFIEQ